MATDGDEQRGRPAVARRRELVAAPLVAAATLVAALIATSRAGIAFRDPDNVAAKYVAIMLLGIAGMIWLDVAVRAWGGRGTGWPTRAAMAAVRRERWTPGRLLGAASGLAAFYVAYLAYRNLKATIPFLTPDLVDGDLASLERGVLGGHEPAELLHSVLGTSPIVVHALSTVYAAFIVFLPLSLAVALVFSRSLSTSLLLATALSLNWLLGAGTYFLLPSLGPVYADPSVFAALPDSEVTRLQGMLLDDRVGFLRDPVHGTPQAIAAFASLHMAMSATALGAAHLLRLGRRLKVALWVWCGLTFVATVYFGWHYVVDDLAGIGLAAISLGLAVALTGYDVRSARASSAGAPREPAAT